MDKYGVCYSKGSPGDYIAKVVAFFLLLDLGEYFTKNLYRWFDVSESLSELLMYIWYNLFVIFFIYYFIKLSRNKSKEKKQTTQQKNNRVG